MVEDPLSPSWSQVSSLPELGDTEFVLGLELEPTSPRTPVSGVHFDKAAWSSKGHEYMPRQSWPSISSRQSGRLASIISDTRSSGTITFVVGSLLLIV
jgi:hypothetical protein